MTNLIVAFNVVLPLLICIALGIFLRSIGMIKDASQKNLNQLGFKVFLPVHVFNSIYTTDIAAAFDGKLMLFGVLGLVGIFLFLMVLVPVIEKENRLRGVMVQAIFRSNFVLYGLPVATNLCGEAHLGPTSLLIGIVVPVFNMLSVVCLEWFRGGKPNFRKMFLGIAKNPLIIGAVVGIAANLSNITIPTAVHKSIIDIARVATPLALIVLGSEFSFSRVRGISKQLIVCVVGKLVVSPLLMVTIGVMLGFRGDSLVPILMMFGAPTAVSSYTMAQQMDGDETLAAAAVVFTAGLSIITIFFAIFLLKQMALI